VTGGAGVIGSHLVDALLDSGAFVTVLDDLSTGKTENLAAHLNDPRLRLIRGSVLDVDAVEDAARGQAEIYHLAAAVGVKHIVNDPVRSILTNVRGTENVLGTAYRGGTRIVIASTSEIYGKSAATPFREDGERVLGPTWIHRWSYSTAKAIDEHLAFAYAQKGLPVTIVRYFNSYGPRIDERGYGSVVARFIGQALSGQPLTVHGDGAQTRCFTYVEDTVRGTMLAATTDGAIGMALNIGATNEISIADLATKVRDLTGSSSPILRVPYESYYGAGFEDTRRRVPDVTRARDVLGFSADIAFDDGLKRTIDWCRANYRGVEAARR
jgi:nucleoside-diphosphate-sugar epimerase